MDSMTAHLRELYTSLDTEELIDLRARGTLTEAAQNVIDEELTKRDVSPSMVSDERKHQAERSAKKDIQVSELASRMIRVFAVIADYVAVLLPVGLISFTAFVYLPKSASDGISYIMLAALILYLLFKDGFEGRSIGSRLFKIVVIERGTGASCSLPRSCIRNLFSVFGIFDLIWVLGRDRTRLGDLVAGTIVVKERPELAD